MSRTIAVVLLTLLISGPALADDVDDTLTQSIAQDRANMERTLNDDTYTRSQARFDRVFDDAIRQQELDQLKLDATPRTAQPSSSYRPAPSR